MSGAGKNVNARNIGDLVGSYGPSIDSLNGRDRVFTRAKKRREAGPRECAHAGCSTKLSSYNDSDRCWTHDK
jgi:hypothetical protein